MKLPAARNRLDVESADGGSSSLPVVEVSLFASEGTDPAPAPDMLIEIPHGATKRRHYDAVRRQLKGDLPEDLVDFFFVNTDVGSAEVARQVADLVTGPDLVSTLGEFLDPRLVGEAAALGPRSILVLRCLIPRTFIDTNRVLDADSPPSGKSALSPAIPTYVRDEEDRTELRSLYARYHAVVGQAYERVCGAGGFALVPHTYAPKAVRVESFDEGIGRALRQAYEPGRYEQWPTRPAVDIISEKPDGVKLAPRRLVEAIQRNYARIGIQATENVTYPLHPTAMGYHYSNDYAGQVLCMEIARDLLAEPFAPFEEMHIAEHKVAAMSAPIAAALVAELVRRRQASGGEENGRTISEQRPPVEAV